MSLEINQVPARTAKGKGEQAHEDNKDMSHNPFDPKSEYDAYTSWNLGWQEADERARREAEAAKPDLSEYSSARVCVAA